MCIQGQKTGSLSFHSITEKERLADHDADMAASPQQDPQALATRLILPSFNFMFFS